MNTKLVFYLRMILLSLVIGTQAALFLWLLHYFSSIHQNHLWIIFLSPLLAIVIFAIEKRFPSSQSPLSKLETEWKAPPRFAANWLRGILHLILSAFSQIFGVTTGRESAALIFSTDSLALFRQELFYHRELLACALAAGFGGIFGAPWAGCIFAIEKLKLKTLRSVAIPGILLSSWMSHKIVLFTGYSHHEYPPLRVSLNDWLQAKTIVELCLGLVSFAILYGLYTLAKNKSYLWIQGKHSLTKKLLVSFMLVGLCQFFPNHELRGMGTELISSSEASSIPSHWPFVKAVTTLLSQLAGFRGGEVTPLMSIGASLGQVIEQLMAWPKPLGFTLGILTFFIMFLKCPLATCIFSVELFGSESLPWALILTLLYLAYSRWPDVVHPILKFQNRSDKRKGRI